MHVDTRAAGFAHPLVGTLYGQLEDAYQQMALLVADMSPKELEYRGPRGDLNSTAMLLAHLPRVDLWWLYAFQDQEVPLELTDKYGREPWGEQMPEIRGMNAAVLLERHQAVREMVRAYLLTQTDADMDRTLPFGQHVVTMRWALWQMAQHSFLHQGQIRWLKRWARERRGLFGRGARW